MQAANSILAKLPHAHKQRTKNHDAENQVHQELQALQARNQDIITYQPARQRRLMSRLGWFIIFIIFIVMAGLFFISGFITCYISYPPRPINLTSNTNYNAQMPLIQNSFDNPTVINSQDNNTFYSYRQKLLKSLDNQHVQSHLLQAENRSKNEVSQAVRSAFNNILDEWSTRIHDTLGPFFGGAIVPLTTGLAQSVVDETLTPTYNADSNTPDHKAAMNNPQSRPQDQAVLTAVGRYSIQIQNFNNSDNALDLANELKTKHYGAYVVRIPTSSGVEFSVRAGSFTNYRDAQTAASTLTRMWNHPTRIIISDPQAMKNNTDSGGP